MMWPNTTPQVEMRQKVVEAREKEEDKQKKSEMDEDAPGQCPCSVDMQ